jgi:hypothetical protein
MLLGRFLVFVVIFVSLAPAYASVCTTQISETYPGWEMRFNGSLAVDDSITEGVMSTVGMKDLTIEVLQILSSTIANLKVSKKGVYTEEFSVAESTNNFDVTLEDVRVKVFGMNSTHVNLTIYTHDQAIVNSTMNITYKSTDINASLPGEIVEIESEVKNIGELEAENLKITEFFGDFQVIPLR